MVPIKCGPTRKPASTSATINGVTFNDGGEYPARRHANPETTVRVGDIGEHMYQADDLDLTRSEQRSWLVHRRLAEHLTEMSLTDWGPSSSTTSPASARVFAGSLTFETSTVGNASSKVATWRRCARL